MGTSEHAGTAAPLTRYPVKRLELVIRALVTPFDFADINKAADAVHSGEVIKPVLRFHPR